MNVDLNKIFMKSEVMKQFMKEHGLSQSEVVTLACYSGTDLYCGISNCTNKADITHRNKNGTETYHSLLVNGVKVPVCSGHYRNSPKSGYKKKSSKGLRNYCANHDGSVLNELCHFNKEARHNQKIILSDKLVDWDHIDGNHDNNDPSNLQPLCKVCHGIKTERNQDIQNTKRRKIIEQLGNNVRPLPFI